MTKQKFINPLSVKPDSAVKSESGASGVKSTSSFNVDSSQVCPKCHSDTVPTRLANDEPIMFCTNCRVSLALEEK